MKKFLFFGSVVLGIAVLAIVNVNLNSKSSSVWGVALKNLEAITQENQEDWHSGECGTDEKWLVSEFGDVESHIKECDFTTTGSMCEYGVVTTFYYTYSPPYTYGSFSIQYCQG
jgi:hypothetical protein